MKKLCILLLIASFGFTSCNNSSKAVASQQLQNGKKVYDFIASFKSIGEGIDTKMFEQLQGTIKNVESKFGITIPQETIGWGREGEKDVLLDLSGLSKTKKAGALALLKEGLSSNLVEILTNSVAPH